MSSIKSQLKEIDEFGIYREVIITIEKQNPDIMKEYYGRLKP